MYILHLICINSKLNLTKAFRSVMMLHRNFVNTLYLVASEGYFYWMIGNSFGILSFNKCTPREDYATAQSFLNRKDIKYGKYEFWEFGTLFRDSKSSKIHGIWGGVANSGISNSGYFGRKRYHWSGTDRNRKDSGIRDSAFTESRFEKQKAARDCSLPDKRTRNTGGGWDSKSGKIYAWN